jgi:hypothetical protein
MKHNFIRYQRIVLDIVLLLILLQYLIFASNSLPTYKLYVTFVKHNLKLSKLRHFL